MSLIISRTIAIFLTIAYVFNTACVSVPKIEGNLAAEMDKLEAQKKDKIEIKSPVVAGALNVFIPGAGQMYAEDYGDGVLTLLTFWLVVPYFMGVVDAVQEARVQNARYTVEFYQKKGNDAEKLAH